MFKKPFQTPSSPEEIECLIKDARNIFGREFTSEELASLRFLQQMMRAKKDAESRASSKVLRNS